jgi:sugar lactone lactonase YvrE
VPEGSTVSALIEYKKEGMAMGAVIDLDAFEQENNPDQDAEVHSNPSDVAVGADGTVYITDASGNDLLTWTEADGLQLFASWPVVEGSAQSVPTSVAIGPEGDIYVGFLGGFPFEAGGTRIEVYSADGALKTTYDGLTLVTDVLVGADGTVYAVQMASGFGDTGFIADSGSVVRVSADGLEAVAEGLPFPYGLALSPDGNLVVSLHGTGGAPENGEVVVVASM